MKSLGNLGFQANFRRWKTTLTIFDREWNSRSLISLFSVIVSSSNILVRQHFQIFFHLPLQLTLLISALSYFYHFAFLSFHLYTNPILTRPPNQAILSIYQFINFTNSSQVYFYQLAILEWILIHSCLIYTLYVFILAQKQEVYL